MGMKVLIGTFRFIGIRRVIEKDKSRVAVSFMQQLKKEGLGKMFTQLFICVSLISNENRFTF
jgi:hypothetical protein